MTPTVLQRICPWGTLCDHQTCWTPPTSRLCLVVPCGRGGRSGQHQGETKVGQLHIHTHATQRISIVHRLNCKCLHLHYRVCIYVTGRPASSRRLLWARKAPLLLPLGQGLWHSSSALLLLEIFPGPTRPRALLSTAAVKAPIDG